MWVLLFTNVVVFCITVDDVIFLSTSFLLLALAGLDFCIGFVITVLFKNILSSLELNSQYKNIQTNKNNVSYGLIGLNSLIKGF